MALIARMEAIGDAAAGTRRAREFVFGGSTAASQYVSRSSFTGLFKVLRVGGAIRSDGPPMGDCTKVSPSQPSVDGGAVKPVI
jgi:hypothetical protein